MKRIMCVCFLIFTTACSGTVENSNDETSLIKNVGTYTDGKADTLYCAVEGEQGCDVIGADCCGQEGFTCQEYTVYDWPRCRPAEDNKPLVCAQESDQGCDVIGATCCDDPTKTCQEYTVYDWPRCRTTLNETFFSVEADTDGGVFACTSVPDPTAFPADVIKVVASNPETENGFTWVNLKIERETLPGTFTPDDFNTFIENSLAGFEPTDDQLIAYTYYYDFAAVPVRGIDGMWTGQVVSKISDDVWDVRCWEPTLKPTARYRQDSGSCVDINGQLAQNPAVTPAMVRGSKFAECMDFEGTAFDEGVYGYQQLTDVNFSGSDLSAATMHFAKIVDGNLNGTFMSTFEYGYAEITGTIDHATAIPENGCETVDGSIACFR